MESKITGNDLRAREAQEAAEAGLERGVAWAKENSITTSINCSAAGTAPCPDSMEVVTGATTGDTYDYDISYVVDSTSVQVISTATGVTDSNVTATAESWVRQIRVELFDSGMTVPPPIVSAGCMTGTVGNPDIYLLDENNPAALSASSSDPSCLVKDGSGSAGFTANTWADTDGSGYKDGSDTSAAITSDVSGEFNVEQRGSFSCGTGSCAWDAFFEMGLADAKQAATDAGHVFTNDIPCGPNTSEEPSIYIINNSGPINNSDIDGSCSGDGVDSKTIGAPNQPILLIIPSAYGCARFNGGMTVYGIVYIENATDCTTNGWGGATVYGSIISESGFDKFNSNTEFVEIDYGSGNSLNTTFKLAVDDSTRIPGTWKDF
jgi:hypothetical protein